ncbi:DUF2167 domain-containing protein [Pelagibacterales bacterium SAG-MED34]|nr:DUF2167 domain-containing protein [Pelagibacterales bacterium SAG-MED34]
MFKKIFCIILFTIYSFNTFAIDKNIPVNNDQWRKAWETLNWIDGPKKVNFSEAQSKIDIDSNFDILTDDDANQLLYWLNGIEFPHVKIYAYNLNDDTQYMFYYEDSGYVKTNDWTEVDPKRFIDEIKENYKTSNEERKKNNLPYVTNVTWMKTPYLDGIYNSVYWALNVQWSDNTSSQEGTALILGREGYTTAKYVAGQNGYNEQMLLNLSKMHKFNQTKEYKDWKSGDKIAAVGIGALLASTLGVKALKPGLIAAALLILKKFWFILFLPFIWVGKLFTSSNKKKTK